MALEKLVVIDSIEILEDGEIQIRQATKIMEDGKELAKKYHRWVVVPGEDVSAQTDRVKNVASVVWTDEVKDKYEDKIKDKDK